MTRLSYHEVFMAKRAALAEENERLDAIDAAERRVQALLAANPEIGVLETAEGRKFYCYPNGYQQCEFISGDIETVVAKLPPSPRRPL